MEKKLVLVGMKDYKTAIEFMCAVANGLCNDRIPVKMPENMRMCIETPNARIVFVYNHEYQQLRNLHPADVVFGLPEYVQPLRTYLKRGAVEPGMGLLEWIVTHERACSDRQQYIRQDVASTALAAAVERATEVLSGAKSTKKFEIKTVKFSGTETRVIWADGTETRIRFGDNDTMDPEKGLALSIAMKKFEIETVHFSGPVTCVIWEDGTKTRVRCGENDLGDPVKGLAMAIAKKVFGTNESGSNYYNIFKKWLPKPEVPKAVEETPAETPADVMPETIPEAEDEISEEPFCEECAVTYDE